MRRTHARGGDSSGARGVRWVHCLGFEHRVWGPGHVRMRDCCEDIARRASICRSSCHARAMHTRACTCEIHMDGACTCAWTHLEPRGGLLGHREVTRVPLAAELLAPRDGASVRRLAPVAPRRRLGEADALAHLVLEHLQRARTARRAISAVCTVHVHRARGWRGGLWPQPRAAARSRTVCICCAMRSPRKRRSRSCCCAAYLCTHAWGACAQMPYT